MTFAMLIGLLIIGLGIKTFMDAFDQETEKRAKKLMDRIHSKEEENK